MHSSSPPSKHNTNTNTHNHISLPVITTAHFTHTSYFYHLFTMPLPLPLLLSHLLLRRSLPKPSTLRFLSTSGTGSPGKDSEEKVEDVFGVDFADGKDNMGTELPPRYKRDATTGRMLDEVVPELNEEQRKILQQMTDDNLREKLTQQSIQEHWDKQGKENGMKWASDLGQKVREANMGLNVLGRSPQARSKQEVSSETGSPMPGDDGFSQRLTDDEFAGFQKYMKKQHKKEITKEDIPVMDAEKSEDIPDWKKRAEREDYLFSDEVELANKWTTTLAQRQMESDIVDEENPYSDLSPGDLTMSRFVSRKKARPIPKELLHHNNVPLLKTFLTPTAQIKHRSQTRLGAKDQRKIAKLIKRSRHLGLMPYYGQFTTEQHGWIHDESLDEEREWEKDLKARGLVIEYKVPETNDDLP